jgi:hypothetical protein
MIEPWMTSEPAAFFGLSVDALDCRRQPWGDESG